MAVKGHSTIIEVGDQATYAGSTTWTKFGNVVDIDSVENDAEDIDLSHMESVEQWEEFTAGWANGGEPKVTVQFDKAKLTTLNGLHRSDKGFRITFSDGSMWKFNGYIKSLGNPVDRKGIVTTTVTMKVSGKPVFVAAS